MGGRIAEELVFGVVSTGASNDLVVNTERARKMVREWGMSDRIGPMAWGSQGQVFLGEDLMHTRDYCDETARVIDEEVERILRMQEDRARELLTEHRRGLDLVAQALLEHETIDGAEVSRLVQQGLEEVHGATPEPAPAPVSSDCRQRLRRARYRAGRARGCAAQLDVGCRWRRRCLSVLLRLRFVWTPHDVRRRRLPRGRSRVAPRRGALPRCLGGPAAGADRTQPHLGLDRPRHT